MGNLVRRMGHGSVLGAIDATYLNP
jgi:hypothetical protein